MTISQAKIKNPKRLSTLRQLWAWEGKKVVFTNGVFDIMHAGHVQLLEQCRAMGDILIVGINSDASARRLGKGSGRPVNKLRDRAALLAALWCVDAVVPFGEDTPEHILSRLKPDILVKGADYRKDQIAGAAHAGRVARVRLKKGYSTTALIRRLQGLR
ncbi:MAG: adenylyltransferase/cytidyltransferase family protein [Elusimicrobiota bacterium]|jgi:D-beta-D-heptose 7-phosphate kinase/D-beta-D-heptose 1-phosphate adenosyltransferase